MRLEHNGDVAVLHMEAGRANAMDLPFVTRLEQVLDELDLDRSRALVLTGYDRYFSAGLALPTLMEHDRPQMEHFVNALSRVLLRLFAVPLPVIAAINGHAIAGGCALALLADVRLLADAPVQIGLNEVQLGVGLPHIIVETVRCQISRERWTQVAQVGHLFRPREALEVGLVDEVVAAAALELTALERARNLGAISAVAFRQVKLALRQPAIERLKRLVEDNGDWLDTWFSEEAQRHMAAAVQRLAGKE